MSPGTWSLESVRQSGWYVRRKDGLAVVDTIRRGGAEARQETTLIVTNGLADRSCFTFRTADGRYLRHYAFRLRFDKPDNSDLFLKDATFCAETGAGGDSVRLRSHNYPDRAIHQRGSELWLDKTDRSQRFLVASSFTVRSPLVPR